MAISTVCTDEQKDAHSLWLDAHVTCQETLSACLWNPQAKSFLALLEMAALLLLTFMRMGCGHTGVGQNHHRSANSHANLKHRFTSGLHRGTHFADGYDTGLHAF